MNVYVWIMMRVMIFCCKRIGWEMAIGKDDDENVNDILVGTPEKIDSILDELGEDDDL